MFCQKCFATGSKWLQTRRVDWDIPHRIQRIDIVQFINYLAIQKASAITRKRKLAAIRGFLKFCKDNQIISSFYEVRGEMCYQWNS
jgi:site-specific recombinase XerD